MSCNETVGVFGRWTHWSLVGLQLTCLLAAAASVASCVPPQPENPSRHGSGLLRLGLALPETGIKQLFLNLSSEPLLSLDESGRALPRLAERWTVSSDRLTWTFTLRRDVRFHDGSRMAADDVLRLLDPVLKGSATGRDIANVERIEARGDSELIVQLARPSSLLTDDLAVTSLALDSSRGGIGPFARFGASPDTTTLVAFGDYYQGRPGIDRIELRQYPTARAAWAGMMRDEVDMLYEVGREAFDFVQADPAVQVYAFPRAYVYTLGFNSDHPLLRHKEVRRALNLAIDRDEIVRQVLRGHGRVAEGYIWPSHWAYDRSAPAYRFDPAEAVRLLDRAGLTPKNRDGRTSRLKLECLVPEQMAEFESMALVLQKQLFKVGVGVELRAVATGELLQRLQKGDFESFLIQLANGRVLSWPYRFLHSPQPGSAPLVNWGYTAADKVLDRIRDARSDDDIRVAVAELQRVLYDDPPAVFIAWDERARAVSRRFHIPGEPGRDILQTLWQWRPAPARETLRAGM